MFRIPALPAGRPRAPTLRPVDARALGEPFSPSAAQGNVKRFAERLRIKVPGKVLASRPSSRAKSRKFRVGRSSDSQARSVRPSRRLHRHQVPALPQTTMASRMDEASTLGHSGGAVPESHRVPCTSALPQERPTTNATIERAYATAGETNVKRGKGRGALRRPALHHGRPQPSGRCPWLVKKEDRRLAWSPHLTPVRAED